MGMQGFVKGCEKSRKCDAYEFFDLCRYKRILVRAIGYLGVHCYTPIVSDFWNSSQYSPVALSIVQVRFVGLVHFSVGLIFTYAAFVIASTS